ncbi:MAG: M56 family metallopeptidase [Aeromicrobium sp.]
MLLSTVLAGVALALPSVPFTTNLAGWVDACALALRTQYSTPGGATVAVVGAGLTAVLTSRLVYCLASEVLATQKARVRQRRALGLVARQDGRSGVAVVTDRRAAAYCLPGRNPQIVVTTGALDSLNDEELSVVLAHERAHIRGRHDFAVVGAAALRRAFPFVPLFCRAAEETIALLEMQADDAAAKVGDRRVLATALVRLAEGPAPMGALAAGTQAALQRVSRLVQPAQPLGRTHSFVAIGIIGAVIVAPVLIAAAPGISAAAMDYCPVTFPI